MGRVGWMFVLVWLMSGRPALATECSAAQVNGTEALQRRSLDERLQYLDQQLQADAENARLWRASWTAIYSALAVGQFTAALLVSRSTSKNLYVGGGAALIGLAPLLITPLKVIKDSRRASELARRDGADPCAPLFEIEGLLERDAANEARGRGALFHAGNVIFNAGIFAIIGAGFGHWTSASISLATGIATGEIMIFTQPVGAIRTLREYRTGQFRASPPRSSMLVVPLVGRGLAGMAFGATF